MAEATARRPGLLSAADAAPGPTAMDEPHPTLMRARAAPPRRAGRLCQERCPGRSRYSFVPGPVAIRRSTGSPRRSEGPVWLGSRAGRVVGRFLLRGAPRRGSGGPWDDASASSPFTLRQPRLISLVPRPTAAAWPGTPRRTDEGGRGRRPLQATGCRGCGPGHPRRTRGPLTMGCHR